ncbi:MAG: hypothetical protein H3C62_00395 [Gemmatimonadaceae bacterium]|nr:hypothetical protein [Gemmatimonadaceae bacterium]
MRAIERLLLLSFIASPLSAQTVGGATMSLGALGVVSTQATSAVSSATGAQFAVAVPFKRTRVVALQVGVRQQQFRDSAAIAQSVLDVGTELRQRLAGGRTPSTASASVIVGVGVSHLATNGRTATDPMGHAGLLLRWPFAESMGLEVHAAAQAVYRQNVFTQHAPATTGRSWTMGLQLGLSFYLQQTTRARRIPVTALPDVTELPVPLRSYQGRLLVLDSTAAAEVAKTRMLATDPDASSGAVVSAPYLERAPIAADSQRSTSNRVGRRTVALADSQVVLKHASPPSAQTTVAEPAVPARAAPIDTLVLGVAQRDTVSASRAVPRLRADSEPSQLASDGVLPNDSVEVFQDSTGAYLSIIPVLRDGHLTAQTRTALASLIEEQRKAAVPATYVLFVSTPTTAAGEGVLDEALALRAWFLTAGVPAAQIAVRQSPPMPDGGMSFRIVIHGQPMASAKRGKTRD